MHVSAGTSGLHDAAPETRRAFLREVCSALVLPGMLHGAAAVRIGLIWPAEKARGIHGRALGEAEGLANLQLFGTAADFTSLRGEDDIEPSLVIAVAGLEDTSTLCTWGRRLAIHGIPLLNTQCTDRSRGATCGATILHIAPAPQAGDRAPMHTWHPGLVPFGAAQLNARHRSLTGAEMTAADWQAWFGCKVAVECVLRRRGSDGSALLNYLLGSAAAFDGHKGRPLRFDRATRELRQPLYPATE